MDNDKYSVESIRISRPWFGTKKFYTPLHEGAMFLDESEMSTVWGFETEDDAWKAIDKYMSQNVPDDEYYHSSYGDREDFHSDG